jgi:hypothetical protein
MDHHLIILEYPVPVGAPADSGDRERPIRSIVNTGSGDHEHLLSLA